MAGLFHYLVNWMNFLTDIEEYRFIEKDKLRYVYRWKLPKFFLCEVICGRCELVEFSYDALPIEMKVDVKGGFQDKLHSMTPPKTLIWETSALNDPTVRTA